MEQRNELERRLRRYRPFGPPLELRARTLDAVARRPDAVGGPIDVPRPSWAVLEWVPATAALASAITFSVLAAGLRGELALHSFADAEREAMRRAVVTALGDDQAAQEGAERLLALDEHLQLQLNSPSDVEGRTRD